MICLPSRFRLSRDLIEDRWILAPRIVVITIHTLERASQRPTHVTEKKSGGQCRSGIQMLVSRSRPRFSSDRRSAFADVLEAVDELAENLSTLRFSKTSFSPLPHQSTRTAP